MKDDLIILDGGMGREIRSRLPSFDPQLWSASALRDRPDLVTSIHKEFILAGAKVITTNNYTVVPTILEKSNLLHKFETFTRLTGELACRARTEAASSVSIAGSLPPLKSTYRPDLILDKRESIDIYQQIAHFLNSSVDLFLIESMSSISEALSVLESIRDYDKPVWVSFILNDNHPSQLLSGEYVSDIGKELSGFNVQALLFNCCQPKTITHALPLLKFNGKTGGYANAFATLPPKWIHGQLREEDTTITPENYYKETRCWVDSGASIIGGCCGIGVSYIQHLSNSYTHTFK